MNLLLAGAAKNDEIFARIFAQAAASLDVVDLKILAAVAALTSLAISLKNLPMQFPVGSRIEF